MKTSLRILLLLLLVLAQPLNATNRTVVNIPTPTIDSTAATQTVMDFLRWYKANLGPISKIYLVNQQPGKNYSVNDKKAERYLTYLKSSHLLTDKYLNGWRTYFKERQAGFRATPQNEGPPDGFEYDLVMLTQEVDRQMDSLKTLKMKAVKVQQNKASVKFFLLQDYEFRLVRQNNRWLINEILNSSAE